MADFFDMGGYAAYVWPAFMISAVVLVAIAVQSYRQLKSAEKELEALRHLDLATSEPNDKPQGGTNTLEGQPHEA